MMMSGKEELNAVEKRVEEVESLISEYQASLGLPTSFTNSDLGQYLNLRIEQIRKMSPEQCAEASFALAQQALYVQQEINKHNQRINWAKTNINVIVTGTIDQYGGKFTPFESRKVLAIKDNDYASKLQELVVKAQQMVDTLAYIPAKIKFVADMLSEYKRTKELSNV
tara:strand:+ start:144 stop:647 length:504 start_codon:yes stop_codon:yes gene_type:complete